MEQEIPEVYDGTVEIMSVAREAGDRTKVAVRSQSNCGCIGTSLDAVELHPENH